jgi:hypothetical protein
MMGKTSFKNDANLSPAFTDLLGAEAILSDLSGSLSPEATVATTAFQACRQDVLGYLKEHQNISRQTNKDANIPAASAHKAADSV